MQSLPGVPASSCASLELSAVQGGWAVGLGEIGGSGPISSPYLGSWLYRLLCSLPLGKMGVETDSFLGGVKPEQCFRLMH